MGVTVIGLNSAQDDGVGTFGTGVMTPTFHCGGMYEKLKNRLYRCASGVQMDVAASHIN